MEIEFDPPLRKPTRWWTWLWAGPAMLVSGLLALAAALLAVLLVVGLGYVILTGDYGSSPPGAQSGFCAKHDCISNFGAGRGSVVQCADGMWSHSGGIQGACSSHGGER